EFFAWFTSGDFASAWSMRVDTLTAVMLVVVTTVSAIVHVYSIGYMEEDPGKPRFFAYLSLFTFAMLMLVTADDFMQLFFGWEGVGLASYLLIGFWYEKPSANAAAMKAFIVNRVGDFGFALGIMGVFYVFRSLNFDIVFEIIANNEIATPYGVADGAPIRELTIDFLGYELHALTTIGVLLFIGAMGKSAQFLLHTWLPDAMEGPTPVSALIHAATMVTAGVFLVCRCSVIYEYAPNAQAMIALVGATTAFFAATVGLLQNDIKKVIAYSTCSQLGYMFFAAGVGAYGGAMFHLFTHAFFKALLFLGAGAVIHAMHHEQDMKKMGGTAQLLPITYILMLVGTVAITGVGIPGTHIGTAGFLSKDYIIESAWLGFEAHKPFGLYAFIMGVGAAVLTAFYSWRLIFLTFHGRPRASEETMSHAHDAPPVMWVPLLPLALGGLAAGMLFFNAFVGEGAGAFWQGSIYGVDAAHGAADGHGASAGAHADEAHAEEGHGGHHVPTWVLWAPFIAMAIGTLLSARWYLADAPRQGVIRPGGIIYEFLANKWYFDELYDRIFVKPAFAIGRALWKGGDGAIIDGFGPNGIAAVVGGGARRIVRLQSGYMYHYAFVMLAGITLFVTLVIEFAG
ncbi:MAG: NADH-quinone oxidoreductase subunit L, partial [Pseudomonadota bacterium]